MEVFVFEFNNISIIDEMDLAGLLSIKKHN